MSNHKELALPVSFHRVQLAVRRRLFLGLVQSTPIPRNNMMTHQPKVSPMRV